MVPVIRAIEYPYTLAPAWDAFGRGAAFGPEAIEDGSIAVPDGPGLGVDLAIDVAAQHHYRPPGTRVAGSRSGLPDRFVGDR